MLYPVTLKTHILHTVAFKINKVNQGINKGTYRHDPGSDTGSNYGGTKPQN